MTQSSISIFKKSFIVLSAVLIFFLLLYVIYRLKSLIPVFLFTLILSYVISIIATYFEKRGIKKNLSKIVSVVIVILIIVVFFSIIVPPIVNETSKLVNNFTSIASEFTSYLTKIGEKIQEIGGENKILAVGIEKIAKYIEDKLPDIMNQVSQKILSFFTSFVKLSLAFIASLILSIFFIFDREKILSWVLSQFPENIRGKITSYSETLNFYLKRYIFVQSIMSTSIGITIWLVASLLKIPYAGTLGFIGAVGEVIPYAGAIFTFLLGVVLSLTVSPLTALWFSIFYIAQQQLTSEFVYPLLWAKAVLKISPFFVLITMLIVGAIFGIWGVLFTVPILIILKITFNYLKEEKILWKIRKV